MDIQGRRVCPACEYSLPEKVATCPNCGTWIGLTDNDQNPDEDGNVFQCSYCHQSHSVEVQFCPNTGKPVRQTERANVHSRIQSEVTPSPALHQLKSGVVSAKDKSKRGRILWGLMITIIVGAILFLAAGQRQKVITVVETVVITWTPDRAATAAEQAGQTVTAELQATANALATTTARAALTATAKSQATANAIASKTAKAAKTATARAAATKTPTMTHTPTKTSTRAPTNTVVWTPAPTSAPAANTDADSSMIVRNPGEKSPGDHPVEVRNETDSTVTIYMYGDKFNYTFYVPAGFQTIYVRPGNYSYTFYSCGDSNPGRGSGTFNSNWYWRFWCP